MKYEVTITLLPYCHAKTPKDQYEMSKDQVLKTLNGEYSTAIVEVAKGKVHYHCMVELEDKKHIARLRYKLRKHCYLGRTRIEQIVDEPSYVAYMLKEVKETTALIGNDPVIKDHFDVLHYQNPFAHLNKIHNNLNEEFYLFGD